MPPASNPKGFTFIELLITVAIIAILASVGIVVYSNAQKNARISKRVQDLEAIRTALELYKSTKGSYPASGSPTGFSPFINLQSTLTPNYMPVLPNDPLYPTYQYQYRSDSIDYKLVVPQGEMTTNDFKSQPLLIDPVKDGTADCTVNSSGTPITGWAIYTPGACDWSG